MISEQSQPRARLQHAQQDELKNDVDEPEGKYDFDHG
jgi:hypothetical protein